MNATREVWEPHVHGGRDGSQRDVVVTEPPVDKAPHRDWFPRAAEEARKLDLAVYSVVAGTPTPALDGALGRLTNAANHSRLSIGSATILCVVGGSRGRAAATRGLASVAVTSAVVNLGVKMIAGRGRPDRLANDSPHEHQVPMPTSSSFPSGHSAAAFAFATGVATVLPIAGMPLRGLAALVAYSRVHTGVHYPGDVIAGALIGTAIAQVTTYALDHQMGDDPC